MLASGCFTLAQVDQHLRWLSSAQEGVCAQIHTFILGSTEAWEQRTLLLLGQRPVLTFSNFGFFCCRVTSQARNLHQRPKKNTSKNKHESQDFMPGTPATHILLAGPLVSLLTALTLSNRAEARADDSDLMPAQRSHASALKCLRGAAEVIQIQRRKE